MTRTTLCKINLGIRIHEPNFGGGGGIDPPIQASVPRRLRLASRYRVPSIMHLLGTIRYHPQPCRYPGNSYAQSGRQFGLSVTTALTVNISGYGRRIYAARVGTVTTTARIG